MQHVSGYVAFLDVLCFSDLISRDDSLELVQDYTHAIQKAVATASREAELRFVLFSDSIMISTHSGDESAFTSLLAACSRIFGAPVALEVPVRGKIAYGAFIRSEEAEAGSIVAGRPINEAYS